MKLLVVAFLYDDNKVSHLLVRSLVRSGSHFLMTFIIRVKSYMSVTNVTLDMVGNTYKCKVFGYHCFAGCELSMSTMQLFGTC